ncbi:MAG TPA: helix-turn-helix domain-containing protein [Candidatus Limnocylindrales bacterium]|nr:helix-turn-helix domain-containing protein [Candidatus Limnocylindrales bacterium]
MNLKNGSHFRLEGSHHRQPGDCGQGPRRAPGGADPRPRRRARCGRGGDLPAALARQVRRLLERYRMAGAAALVHGNRGRTPVNRTASAVRARLVELATTEFTGFNPVRLAERLAEEGRAELAVSPGTTRRIMAEAGQALPRTRRPARHRSRRERMPRAGMLLQVDGSRHDWLEGRGPMLTLIGGRLDRHQSTGDDVVRSAKRGATASMLSRTS